MKSDSVPKESAKDIQLLFSRAGMSGGKYREFARPEPAVSEIPTSVPVEIGASAEKKSPPKVVATAESAAPFNTVAAPVLVRSPTAIAPGYHSLDRIFAGRALEPQDRDKVASGVKLAILSLAGGVGKTTLAVTLARILSSMHKQVVVGDFGRYPTASHHFGPRGQRLGALQFFLSPSRSAALPIAIFNQPVDQAGGDDFQQLLEQVKATDITLLMDLPTLQGVGPGEAVGDADHVLVPVTPDVHSVIAAIHLEEMFSAATAAGKAPQIHYVINRYNESRPLHGEIKTRLEQLLGPKLLPVVIHEDQGIEEAAAHGMTIVDDCPDSPAVQQFAKLANWICGLCAEPLEKAKEGQA